MSEEKREWRHFDGVVTAVDSNMNVPTRCFTAQAANGQVKVFEIASLKDLDVGDRVVLHYRNSDHYPLEVKTIRFIAPPKGGSPD